MNPGQWATMGSYISQFNPFFNGVPRAWTAGQHLCLPSGHIFVPPPAGQVLDCMGKLELFLQDQPEPTPALLKAALAHVQFETIHPFIDGNGRLGRLLITLLLCEQKMLREPMLYLSLYFKTHRQY